MSKSSKSKVLDTRQLAKRLGVSVATVFTWVGRGLIHSGRRMGRYRIWTEAEADAVAAQTQAVHHRLEQTKPILRVDKYGRHWSCPICGWAGKAAATVRMHLRCCPAAWACAAKALAPRASTLFVELPTFAQAINDRKMLLDLAAKTIDGEVDFDVFVARARARLARIRSLEDELRRLRSEG